MSGNIEDRAYDWDDEIEYSPSDFVLLPDGEYEFEVANFERAHHPGSEKLPPCNKAVLTLKIFGGELGTATVRHNLFLHGSVRWRVSAFFASIGLLNNKEGAKIDMNWNKVPNGRGRAKVGTREYQGNKYNEIIRFLEPAAEEEKRGYREGDF